MPFAIPPNSRLLFTGDSITDCGRRDAKPPLGSGYVQMAYDLICARYPDHNLTVINTGISGNTVRDLFDRWTDDVVRHEPDWLSMMIGINDINSHLANWPERSVSPGDYGNYYEKVLERTRRETKASLVLIEPFFISRDTDSASYRARVMATLPEYQATAERMASKFDARYVRFHKMFQEQLKRWHPDRYCPEPVHPNATGHLMMAHEWLRTLDF